MRETREQLSDRLRLLLLLDACEAAGVAPIALARLHAMLFFASVLAPIWSVTSIDGKVLKDSDGPFYPDLQRELDRLVGLGYVIVRDVSYVRESNRWRLNASYALNTATTGDIFAVARSFETERRLIAFLRRLAYAISQSEGAIESFVGSDATWSDVRTGTGDIIDFAEWRRANYSAYVAHSFNDFAPTTTGATRGEMLQLYLRLLERRANAS
ncbi:MAG TPA: hypothetical protein VGF28_05500 [Thermoanaerobaculia bacterium]|jgi:hypothetical protein